MLSAEAHPDAIEQYIEDEVLTGRMFGPLSRGLLPAVHVNRMGVLPKGRTSGKWDLSFPDGSSVNDGIDSRRRSLHYT